MNNLYKKNELTFAILWIVIYAVGMGRCKAVSASIRCGTCWAWS